MSTMSHGEPPGHTDARNLTAQNFYMGHACAGQQEGLEHHLAWQLHSDGRVLQHMW
jgi:hypothetical protein